MEDTRRAIMDHAVALVAEHGVRDVSFREVARRAARVSHQAPYHHFKNLQGILDAIAREGFETLTRAMLKAARHQDPIEAYNGIGIAYVKFAMSYVGHLRGMFQRGPTDAPAEYPSLKEGEETYQTLVDTMQGVVDSGYGKFLEADALALLSWSVVHGLATLTVQGKLQKKTKREINADARRVVESLVALVVQSAPGAGDDE